MARTAGAAALAAALLLAVSPLGAQRIVGNVSTLGGGSSGGVLIVARDSTGAEFARAVTAEDGRYALLLPRPGHARVELLRVGFQPTVILERVVNAGEVVTLDPAAGTALTDLPLRGATPPSSCSNDETSRRYVGILLDEVRKALLAAQLGLSRPGVTARWIATDHRLHANGRDTSRFTIARKAGPLLSAFGNPVLGDLQRSGFVTMAGADRIFRGLDVPALLAPWFTESYCFTAREASPTTFLLVFEPRTRRRDYVDITGEIQVARATMELISISYLYVGLTADESKREAGGRMEFARANGGSWLVSSWWIRFPQVGLIELETFRQQNQARVMQPEVLGHEILGGQTTALLEGPRRVYVREVPATTEMSSALRAVCHERVVPEAVGAFQGRLTVGVRPVAGSRIRATWRVGVDIGGEVPLWRDDSRETVTSARGDWVLCDLPGGVAVELSWEVMGRRSSATLRAERNAVLTVDADGKLVSSATTPD
ncbi:MAG: carboxypeptidase-like regulatory domain-containing protein [Gemmatimonadaceae bacterium]